MVTARRAGRILVWPSHTIAHAADAAAAVQSKHGETCPKITVWPTYQQAVANMEFEEGGGGGGEEEWVPEGAVIHIDFVGGDPQGRAWVEGTGEVEIDTLVGSDLDASGGWGDTSYEPEDLTVDGLHYGTAGTANPPALIGEAKSMILAAATTVIKIKAVPSFSAGTPLALVSIDGSNGVFTELQTTPARVQVYSNGGPLSLLVTDIVNTGVGNINKVAITLTSSRFELAVNGSAAAAAVLDSSDRPPGDPFVGVVIDAWDSTLQTITIYDPLPDTTGLSELSETGV